MLCGLPTVQQAAIGDCLSFDLANHFKCLVAAVHHVGLGDEKRLRGHSSFLGALDVSILSERKEGALSATLTVMKLRDEEFRPAENAKPREDPQKLADRQRQAFYRAINDALKALILMACDRDGTRFLWLP
jgi:hypothetical protein